MEFYRDVATASVPILQLPEKAGSRRSSMRVCCWQPTSRSAKNISFTSRSTRQARFWKHLACLSGPSITLVALFLLLVVHGQWPFGHLRACFVDRKIEKAAYPRGLGCESVYNLCTAARAWAQDVHASDRNSLIRKLP